MEQTKSFAEMVRGCWKEWGGEELLTPNATDAFVLGSMLVEIENFARLPAWKRRPTEWYARQMIWYGVRYKPSGWTPDPITTARRMELSRTIRRLDKNGFLNRRTEDRRDRISHLRFTPGGLSLALDLAGDQVDFDVVRDGLNLTEWGNSSSSLSHLPDQSTWMT